MFQGRLRPWQLILGVLVVGIVALILVWNWDWFIPVVSRVASAQLGRPVTMAHLHVRIAENPVLEADGLVVGNPPDFPGPGPLARIGRLAVTLNGPAYVHNRALIVPGIVVDRPDIQAIALPDGRNNWTFPFGGPSAGGQPSAGPQIGDLRITDGHVHAVDPKLKADFQLGIATSQPDGGAPAQLIVTVNGTYANQPITGHFTGGALLSLRDKTNPYPVDLHLANGQTHVALQGTVENPLAFAGTRLKLNFTGQSLADLLPLTGIATPPTPPFSVTGNLDYADKRIRLTNIEGRVGKSDLEGSIAVDPGSERPQVKADLHSRQVDLADLGGVIGTTPGRISTPGQTPQQRAELKKTEASDQLLPTARISLPKLRAADVDLTYKGDHIEGRSIPLDNLSVVVAIRNGEVEIHPVTFGVGTGRIDGTVTLAPSGERDVRARIDLDFRQVDVARLLSATHTFGGAGTIGGRAVLTGTGDSVAAIMGSGNGELKLFMTGGDLSSLLVDLSGLEFGSALLSSLGMPKRTGVRCMVSDFVLRDGILDTRTMLLDTGEANLTGKGSVNFRDQTIDYQLRTEPKHFTIGSLPAPIDITGRLGNPAIKPDPATVAARGAVAAGLGVLLTPLAALLPTIQLGLGKNNDCGEVIRSAQEAPAPPRTGAAAQ
jgi:AsmA family protein